MLGSAKLGRQKPPPLVDVRRTKHQPPCVFGPFVRERGLTVEYEVYRYEAEGALEVGPDTIWEGDQLRCTAAGCDVGVLHYDVPALMWFKFETILHDVGHEFFMRRGALPWHSLHTCDHSTGPVSAGVIWHGLNFRAHFAHILVTK